MLSFRFQLTSAQLDVLLSIYAGAWHPSSKVTEGRIPTGTPYDHPQFVSIVDRLQGKGLVLHIERRAKKGEKVITLDGCVRGYVCTERGRMMAQMAIESAQRLIVMAKVAESRGLDRSSLEAGVA